MSFILVTGVTTGCSSPQKPRNCPLCHRQQLRRNPCQCRCPFACQLCVTHASGHCHRGIRQFCQILSQRLTGEPSLPDPPLSSFEDTANSLGKPIFSGFPTFRGVVYEFRVHDTAYSEEKLFLSRDSGMDKPLGPEVHQFTASSHTVRSGSVVTLEWEASEGSTISISPGVLSGGAVSGSVDVVVGETTTYTLRAEDEDGVRVQELAVEIDDLPRSIPFQPMSPALPRSGIL